MAKKYNYKTNEILDNRLEKELIFIELVTKSICQWTNIDHEKFKQVSPMTRLAYPKQVFYTICYICVKDFDVKIGSITYYFPGLRKKKRAYDFIRSAIVRMGRLYEMISITDQMSKRIREICEDIPVTGIKEGLTKNPKPVILTDRRTNHPLSIMCGFDDRTYKRYMEKYGH